MQRAESHLSVTNEAGRYTLEPAIDTVVAYGSKETGADMKTSNLRWTYHSLPTMIEVAVFSDGLTT